VSFINGIWCCGVESPRDEEETYERDDEEGTDEKDEEDDKEGTDEKDEEDDKEGTDEKDEEDDEGIEECVDFTEAIGECFGSKECVDFTEARVEDFDSKECVVVLYFSHFPVILFLRVPDGHRLGVS
jgi:hypothetical protein